MNVRGFVRRPLREARRVAFGRRGPRWNIPADLTVEDFFAELNDREIGYCILRWWEDLPEIAAGEDIDMLVSDDDLPRLETLLGRQRLPIRTAPLDIYSESGLPNSDHQNVAYYPPHIAEQILADTRLHRGVFRVPSDRTYFRSLAYHSVVRKGPDCGVPLHAGTPSRTDHDYAGTLARLAPADDFGGPITLRRLRDHLDSVGWLPAADTIDRFRPTRRWFDELFERGTESTAFPNGTTVYLIRARARELGLDDAIVRELSRSGLEILFDVALDDKQRTIAQQHLRGGVWHRGPFPVSGGPPVRMVVAIDAFQPFRTDEERGKRPFGTWAKERTRERVTGSLPRAERFNPVHSTDDAQQAADYVSMIAPDSRASIERLIESLARCQSPPTHSARLLPTTMRRATVWSAEIDGQPAIIKRFRPGARAFFERELAAHELLHNRPEVPELIGSGDGWLARERIEHSTRRFGTLPLPLLRQLVDFADHLNEQGLVLLDLSPSNVIADSGGQLKVLDFEFLFEGQPVASSLRETPSVRGVDESWSHDSPLFASRDGRSAASAFTFAATGLPRFVALSRNDRLQRATRVILRPVHLIVVDGRRFGYEVLRPLAPRLRRFLR